MSKKAELFLYYKPNCPYSIEAENFLKNYSKNLTILKAINKELITKYKEYLVNTFNYQTFPALVLKYDNKDYLIGGSDDIKTILKKQNKLLSKCQQSKSVFKKTLIDLSNKVNLESKLICIFFKTLYS